MKPVMTGLKAGFLGNFLYYCLPVRRQVVLENIKTAFGQTLSEAARRHLAKAFYRHIALTLWENICFEWMSDDAIRTRIEVRGFDHILKASGEGRGAIFLTGHLGNWEVASMAGILHHASFRGRLHILRRQIGNKTIERILFGRFYRMGLKIIPKRSSLYQVMDALSSNDAVAFIMDQYAKPGKEGIIADFFGRPAGTFRSLAVVARASGAPVIPCKAWRAPDGRHMVEFGAPVSWISDEDPDREVLLNTESYNRVLADMICRHPDQWLWIHKRWKIKSS